MKKIILIVLTFALVIFVGFKIYVSRQNLNSLKEKYPNKSFNINEELVSEDGYLRVKVFKIESDYTGIDLYYTMELSEEIKEKGFENCSTGEFSLMVNPIEEEYDFTKEIRGKVATNQFEDHDCIQIHFDRENLEYDDNDLIRIYFKGARFIKDFHEVIEFDLRDGISNKEIDLDGLGNYCLKFFNYDENEQEIEMISRIESHLKNPLSVGEYFYGYKDGIKYDTKGGSGSGDIGSNEPLITTSVWQYKVDTFFNEAEKGIIEINDIEMFTGEYGRGKRYFQFRFSELE